MGIERTGPRPLCGRGKEEEHCPDCVCAGNVVHRMCLRCLLKDRKDYGAWARKDRREHESGAMRT